MDSRASEALLKLLQPLGVSLLNKQGEPTNAGAAADAAAAGGAGNNRTVQQTETSHVRRNLREQAQACEYKVPNRTRVLGEMIYIIKLMLSDQLDASIDILYGLSWKLLEFCIAKGIVDAGQFVDKTNIAVLDWVHDNLHNNIPAFCVSSFARAMMEEFIAPREVVTATSVKNMREYAEDRLFIWHGYLHKNVTELGIVRQSSVPFDYAKSVEDDDDSEASEIDTATGVKQPKKKGSPRAIVSLYAIFDGHGGSFAAEYACKHLSIELAGAVARTLNETDLIQNGFQSKGSVEQMRDRMLESFQTIDKEICDIQRRVEKTESGSTATVCVVVETPAGVVPVVARSMVMWIGDTQAYVVMMPKSIGGGKAEDFEQERREVLFTSAHNTRNDSERQRIKKLDAKVLPDDSFYILNTLSVTRAFGDMSCRPYAVCEPEFWSADMSRPWLLVLASDGLWDTVAKEQILACSERMLERNSTTHGVNVSRELCQLAMKNGSLDNITVAVITFK